MALSVRPAIPMSQVVNIVPSVLSAGGAAFLLCGLVLTQNYRCPIGQVLVFVDAAEVEDFFGPASQEAALATIYFLGPNNATALPSQIMFTQYPESAVSGWLQGGDISGMTLTTLQAIDASLTLTIDGTPATHTINLSAATSFSNAAEIIAHTFTIEGVEAAVVTGAIGGTFGTCTSASTVLTVGSATKGYLSVGDTVNGTDSTNTLSATVLAQLTGPPGGAGTYTVSAAATPGDLTSCTVTGTSTILDVTAVTSGTLGSGDVISGTGVTANTYITGQASGTIGGVGFYNLSGSAQATGSGHDGSSETVDGYSPAVQYDSLSGSLFVFSGTTGALSSVAFASGAAAISLKLTQATGAVVSPGAAAGVPGTFMDNIVNHITQNWASFMTTWEPVDADKEAFATWNNDQRNRFVYEMWSTNVLDTESSGPSPPVAFVNSGELSGIEMIWDDPNIDTVGGSLAAFAMGWTASLDFTRLNGKQTAAFKGQSGIQIQVTDADVANYLQSYGLNFYGDYTTAAQAFFWWINGTISGPFAWKDDFVNQIWLNQLLQVSIAIGLTNTPSIPYNLAGAALIESFVFGPANPDGTPSGPVNIAVQFGMIQAGVALSSQQMAEVNNMAGLNIATTLFNRGWYLQVLPATAPVRAARTSPPCTLWYTTGGSVQRINLASIEVQ